MKSIIHSSKHTPWYEWVMLIVLAFVCIIVGLNFLYGTGFHFLLDKDFVDSYGSLLGGLGGLCGIYYLYKTLRNQNEAQQLSSFETRYIQLISFNRSLLHDMHIGTESDNLHGTECFQLFVHVLKEAYNVVDEIISKQSINELYKDADTYNKDLNLWDSVENLKKRTIINISYLITFIGVKKLSLNQLKFILNKTYKEDIVNNVISTFQVYIIDQDNGDICNMNPVVLNCLRNNENKKYRGFQNEFGNYFRLLFQIFRYLNEQTWLSNQDKYTYAKMLRSQLSNYEELLLFYNSLSDYGLEWEYNKVQNDDKLITKFKLIKNIPFDQDLAKLFYPNINFENGGN